MYLKAHSNLSANGLVVRLWVNRINVGSLNSPRGFFNSTIYIPIYLFLFILFLFIYNIIIFIYNKVF